MKVFFISGFFCLYSDYCAWESRTYPKMSSVVSLFTFHNNNFFIGSRGNEAGTPYGTDEGVT